MCLGLGNYWYYTSRFLSTYLGEIMPLESNTPIEEANLLTINYSLIEDIGLYAHGRPLNPLIR